MFSKKKISSLDIMQEILNRNPNSSETQFTPFDKPMIGNILSVYPDFLSCVLLHLMFKWPMHTHLVRFIILLITSTSTYGLLQHLQHFNGEDVIFWLLACIIVLPSLLSLNITWPLSVHWPWFSFTNLHDPLVRK